MPMKVTTLRLTERLWTLLEAQAREEGTSASQLIREGAMMRLGYALGKQGREVPASGSPSSNTPAPFADFASASVEILDLLHGRLGFSLWLVTRVEKDQWVIEQARDEAYGVEVGDAYRFADTYCARMVEGEGPRFAPEASTVPCYAAAAIGNELPIAAYIGVPLLRADGSLFGTLCGIDPAPQPPAVGQELPLVELSGRLLSSLLERDAGERRN
ncbi:MAG TPA: GAF domain-containing protein [Thermoleophilaceae bacterium]|nr:GAF domain-containing protein [Thermoleophilaceae bacterium]